MPFVDTNIASGLRQSSKFQQGRANVDRDEAVPEQGIGIPWASESAASYVYYDCTVGVMLDSGIVVHNRLPQYNGPFTDTLAQLPLDDPRLDNLAGPGVNLLCRDQYQDIVQRMGHARYWFRLWGQALRIGYKIPIPGLVSVGGVPAIPYDKNPQWAYNSIVPGGSYSGAILWRAQWSLWYTTAVPPYKDEIPAVNLLAHIDGRYRIPTHMQAPFSQADDNARPARS